MESIREIVKRRDEVNDEDVNELFADAAILIEDGYSPDDVLQDVFGLEPDYFMDPEFMEIWS